MRTANLIRQADAAVQYAAMLRDEADELRLAATMLCRQSAFLGRRWWL